MKFNILVFFFENASRKFKFNYNRAKINGTLHEDQYVFSIISRSVLLRMKNVSEKKLYRNYKHTFYVQ